MAFGLTHFRAYKGDTSTVTPKRGVQCLEFTITRGAAGDTDLDLGDIAGTFWTAVKDTNTATQAAYNLMKQVLTGANMIKSCFVVGNNVILNRVTSSPTAATEYTLSNELTFPLAFPSITLTSNAAPATMAITIDVGIAVDQPILEFEF